MVWAIPILALTNMAIGYGLAVYLHGKGGNLITIKRVVKPPKPKDPEPSTAQPVATPAAVAEPPADPAKVAEQESPAPEAETSIDQPSIPEPDVPTAKEEPNPAPETTSDESPVVASAGSAVASEESLPEADETAVDPPASPEASVEDDGENSAKIETAELDEAEISAVTDNADDPTDDDDGEPSGDDANVLAGIEAFRSQLAKMSDSDEEAPAEDEDAEELAEV